jgi:ribosome-associated translation inhibitor RaiA
MKLTVQHHHIRSTAELDSLLEERILALQPRLQIDEANIRLERRHDQSPAFSVSVHLVTPGPDVIAEASDHSTRAAIGKVLAELERKIGERNLKRTRRVRSNLQTHPEQRLSRARR